MKNVAIILSLLLFNCNQNKSSIKITDEYIQFKNDPKLSVIYEVNVLKFDSVLHYPVDETIGTIYSIVHRKTHKPITENSAIKMYFSNYNDKYCWEVMKDPTLANYTYQDTLVLKKKTWYKVRNEQQGNELYFFWTGTNGEYRTEVKPLPSPGPW